MAHQPVSRRLRRRWRIACLLSAVLLLALLSAVRAHAIVSLYKNRPYSFVFLDQKGRRLGAFPVEGSDGLMREWVAASELPPHVAALFIAGEDRRFYSHFGVDWIGVARAARQNRQAHAIRSGASTLTMQLARRLRGASGGNRWRQKLREAFDAFGLELVLSKADILSGWLSNLPFGFNTDGVESASQKFFKRSAASLTAEEAALLAVLPRSPQKYHPIRQAPALLQQASGLLRSAGFSYYQKNLEAALAAMQQGIQTPRPPLSAPHFCWRCFRKAVQDVGCLRAKGSAAKWGGASYRIQTSLNLDAQLFLEAQIHEALSSAGPHRLQNASAVVVNSATGEPEAYVGSVDFYRDSVLGQNDGVVALHWPGSTLKPFIYELALESGWSAARVLPDVPMEWNEAGGLYRPLNFNNRFSGPVRLREALASSLNVPAVWTVDQLGVDRVVNRLVDLGMDSLTAQRPRLGVGIALGAASVSLWELTRAYAALAHYGVNGGGVAVMKRDCAELMIDILTDYSSRIRGFGEANPFSESGDYFLKTGTSNQFNDLWAFAGSPDWTVGVWMGNFSGETVMGVTGSSLPAAVAVRFLREGPLPHSRFSFQTAFEEREICALSGGTPTPWCPKITTEKTVPGTRLSPCPFHREGGLFLPARYHEWARGEGIAFRPLSDAFPLAGASAASSPRILKPIPGARYFYNPTRPKAVQRVPLQVDNGPGTEYRLLLNGELLYEGRESFSEDRSLPPDSYCLRVFREGQEVASADFRVE